MERRQPLYPELGISRRLEGFPPSQPPKGKDILERFFDVLFSQPKNSRNADSAALKVAKELIELWTRGDGRIPLNGVECLKRRIIAFRDDLSWLNKKSMKTRPVYAVKVRSHIHNRWKSIHYLRESIG